MAAYAGPWNYHERNDKGAAVITVWISSSHLSKKAQARLDRALDQLRHMPKTSWSKPAPASNIGDHTYVIRFKDESGMQHRVFGHFYDPHLVFVLTFNGYEKDDVYHPGNYQDVAQRHRITCDAEFHARTVKFRHYCSLCKPAGSKAKQPH